MRVAGLVAAAGASSRMGRPKALLPFYGGRSFALRLTDILVAGGCAPVVVTLPSLPDPPGLGWQRLLDELALTAVSSHVTVDENPEPALGLSGSVRRVLSRYDDSGLEGIVLCPVDAPFADAGLVEALIQAIAHAPAAYPSVGDRRGHPVAFSHAAFELLLTCGDRGGPRAVLDALGDDARAVPWGEPRVCDDVNTPADYRRLFGKDP
jgi:molybdenum cofactor cytidylyltransferase